MDCADFVAAVAGALPPSLTLVPRDIYGPMKGEGLR